MLTGPCSLLGSSREFISSLSPHFWWLPAILGFFRSLIYCSRLCLCLCVTFPVCSGFLFSLFWKILAIGLRPTLTRFELILTWLHLQRPPFPNKVIFTRSGIGTSAYLLEGIQYGPFSGYKSENLTTELVASITILNC